MYLSLALLCGSAILVLVTAQDFISNEITGRVGDIPIAAGAPPANVVLFKVSDGSMLGQGVVIQGKWLLTLEDVVIPVAPKSQNNTVNRGIAISTSFYTSRKIYFSGNSKLTLVQICPTFPVVATLATSKPALGDELNYITFTSTAPFTASTTTLGTKKVGEACECDMYTTYWDPTETNTFCLAPSANYTDIKNTNPREAYASVIYDSTLATVYGLKVITANSSTSSEAAYYVSSTNFATFLAIAV